VGFLRRGVGYDDVSVVTNLSADHLGVDGIDTLDQLAEVKAVILRSGCGVRATLSVTSSAHRIGFAVILPLPGGQRWSVIRRLTSQDGRHGSNTPIRPSPAV
jgi:hypothetical protein